MFSFDAVSVFVTRKKNDTVVQGGPKIKLHADS